MELVLLLVLVLVGVVHGERRACREWCQDGRERSKCKSMHFGKIAEKSISVAACRKRAILAGRIGAGQRDSVRELPMRLPEVEQRPRKHHHSGDRGVVEREADAG